MIESFFAALFTFGNLLIIGGLIGLGYFLKGQKKIPNKRISTIQTIFSLHICLFKVPDPIDAICVAFILAGLAQIFYTSVLSNIEEFIQSRAHIKRRPSPTAPRMMTSKLVFVGLLIGSVLGGCAHYRALPPDATAEQKKAAALADTRAALGSKRNQIIAEILISEAGKYAVSTVKDKVDKEAIKTQLRGCGEAGLALLASGKDVTPDQMRAIFSISSLTSKLDADKFSSQFNSSFDPVQDYIDEVSQTNDPKLMREWWGILCRGSIKAGS